MMQDQEQDKATSLNEDTVFAAHFPSITTSSSCGSDSRGDNKFTFPSNSASDCGSASRGDSKFTFASNNASYCGSDSREDGKFTFASNGASDCGSDSRGDSEFTSASDCGSGSGEDSEFTSALDCGSDSKFTSASDCGSDSEGDDEFTSASNGASDCGNDSWGDNEFTSASTGTPFESSNENDLVQHQEFIMYEQQRISAVASSSNSSSMVSSKKYDVFLSFRGEDTRLNFVSHLYKALDEKKVETYIDNRLQKGDEISEALTKAIEDSHVSIVIFSKNYASSKWCLGELSKILECKKVQGQIVIPVFYGIDPSHVRKQTGSYKQAFAKHEGDTARCCKWRHDLTEAANLAGWDSRNRTEPEFLKDIVEDVWQKLAPRYYNQCKGLRKGLVGIEESYTLIKSKLKIGSSEVKTIGIWGMGGIGKTTLATALYENLSHEFEGCCFLASVREKPDKLKAVREELFSKLLGIENKKDCIDHFDIIKLRCKKVFIVLDDVTTSEQLQKLILEYDFLGPGSRVIVTTRNRHILRLVDEIYRVQVLSFDDSLQLFCLTAFKEKQPKDGYEDLSKRVVSYCQGIPLALKVLGASLHSRTEKAWEYELEKLQNIPKMEILEVLKLSYDGLDRYEKDIFLDIACFFKGQTRDYVTSVLEACDFFPALGIEVLLDKALITISYHNEIEMHDLIQEMGREIVYQESTKNPGSRSRLWKPEEVYDVLNYNKGTSVVEGIIINSSKLIEDLYVQCDSLSKMSNLRFLQIIEDYGWSDNRINVDLTNGHGSLFGKLKYLYWERCRLECLPSNFCAEQLVELHMWRSKLKKLWDGVQNLVNLKKIVLTKSRHLIEIPYLSKAKKLKMVQLGFCKRLHQLHPSILSHPNFSWLHLNNCTMIESLHLNSKSLIELNLHDCSLLKEISVTSEELTKLDLSGTSICTLPSSISSLHKLTCLDLSDCKVIESLDLHSKSLIELNLRGCSLLKEISVTSEELTELYLSGTAICALPSPISSLQKLTYLDLADCKVIESFNLHSKSLRVLNLYGCSSLKEISVASEEMTRLVLSGTAICALPSSISSLNKLTHLYLSDCKAIESLDLHSKSLRELYLYGCSSLKEILVASEEMTKLVLSGTAICALPSSISSLHKLTCLDLSDCKAIESLDLDLKSLRELNLYGCSSLKEISVASEELTKLNLLGPGPALLSPISIPSHRLTILYPCLCKKIERINLHSKSLRELSLRGFSSLKEISVTSEELTELDLSGTAICALPSSISSLHKLTCLYLSDCKAIESLDLHLKSLRKLNLSGCSSLKEISVASEEMTELDLSGTAICALPSSISSLHKLTCLDLSDCTVIESLDLHLKSLRELDLSGCSSLKEISVASEELTKLILFGTDICASPSSDKSFCKLTYFDLSFCIKIERINLHSKSLRELNLSGFSTLKEISVISEELTELDLSSTAICSLPSSISSLQKLTYLDLSDCKVIEILDLHSKSLRGLNLNGCSSLKEISVASEEMTGLDLSGTAIFALPSSISSLHKLAHLYLSDCKAIESLDLHSKSLRELNLSGCSSLQEISVASEEMTGLDLSGTAICALPSSISSLHKLTCLDLSDCKAIESLDLHSKSLRELNLSGCSSLKEISVASEEMTKLVLSGTAICALPSSISSLHKLTCLDLSDCKAIESLDLDLKSLRELNLYGCSSLKEISVASEELTELILWGPGIGALPSSIPSLHKPGYLDFRFCKKIERINLHSKSLRELCIRNFSTLKEITVIAEELIGLNLSGCRVIESLNFHSKSLKLLVFNGCSSLKEISLKSEEMTILKFSGTTICALPSSIGHLLSLEGSNVESLPENIKNFSLLRELNLKDCRKLMSLPELPPSLRELNLKDCRKLMSLPELPPSLRVLQLDDCRKLMSLPELPPTLFVVSAFNCISLETEITQQLVLQHMLQNCIPYVRQLRPNLRVRDYFAFPGDHVMDKCRFRTAESSITVPCLPISHISGFIYCIILSKGSVSHDILVSIKLKVWDSWDSCDGWDDRYGCCRNPISEHVIFWYHDLSKHDRISEVYDHSRDITLIFKFDGDKESIKGFGVFPIFATASGFELVNSSSSTEIFELESITQISDNEPQPREIGAGVGVGGFNNENEDNREQLPASTEEEDFNRNDNHSCGCFIDFLLKRLWRTILMANEH